MATSNGDDQLKKGSTQTLILATLADAPRHGYAIAREIDRKSRGALQMNEGALYPALRQLEREGAIVSEWVHPASGPARRVYSLTESGHTLLARQRSAWSRFADAVTAILEPEESPDASTTTAKPA